MLVMSRDGKIVLDCAALQVQKNLAGGKDGKFMIMGGSQAADYGYGILAVFPEEKLAIDALAKAFEAFSAGAASYKF